VTTRAWGVALRETDPHCDQLDLVPRVLQFTREAGGALRGHRPYELVRTDNMAMSSRPALRRPLRRLTQAELDLFLDKAADILRGNVDHSEFRGYVFSLLFFKRISDVYQEEVRKLVDRLGDEELAKDPKMHNFVVPDGALWAEVARTSRNELGTALNDAMIAIERANQPKFDGILTNKIDFNKSDELPREKLVNLINHFGSQTFDKANVSDDLFGNAYEHLIRNFASKAGKSSGEFYTPAEVAYLMAEIIEPAEGQWVCDWAAGSGGLLLQCRNFVHRQGGDPNRVALHAQESNVATYNISRINMILHGVPSWVHRQSDSLRTPRLLDDQNRLLAFDRIVMNPPFSLEDWGYDDLVAGDPHERFDFGMPPRDNADYAWLQQVVKTLRPNGKAIVVMSQGVLFRGNPEQTEEDDGRNKRAGAEYVIREGFVENDLIEAIIVLPSKLFYGNNVPACLVVLNRAKPDERRGRILMIWASRHFQKANPQNILRPSDLMRVLVPWRAFGDLSHATRFVPEHEKRLIGEEEAERTRRLRDIADAYEPILSTLAEVRRELTLLIDADYRAWRSEPTAEHPFFGPLLELAGESARLRTATAGAKKAYATRLRLLRREAKELEKLVAERDHYEQEVADSFGREIEHIHEAASELLAVCSDPDEAARHFTVVETADAAGNEFNLNVPRYVNTWHTQEIVPPEDALAGVIAGQVEIAAAVAKLVDGLSPGSQLDQPC
jgi:type I restriction enzyme M protein